MISFQLRVVCSSCTALMNTSTFQVFSPCLSAAFSPHPVSVPRGREESSRPVWVRAITPITLATVAA